MYTVHDNKKITQERDHTKKLLYAKSRCPKPRDNVEQYEEQDDEAEDEVAHQFAIVLAGSHHEVDTFHAARQKTGRAVKVTVLPKHTEICVHTAVYHGRVQSWHEQLTGMIELHVVLLYYCTAVCVTCPCSHLVYGRQNIIVSN